MNRYVYFTYYLFYTILVCQLTACITSKKVTPEDSYELKQIVVLPTDSIDMEGKDIVNGQALKNGATVLNDLIDQYLGQNKRMKFLSAEQQETLLTEYNQSRAAQIISIGKKSGSDAVLTSRVNRYQERTGQDYSVDFPASVSFEYRLTLVENGQTLCAGVFDETQKSITDNILSFKKVLNRGGKWITTEELAKEGVEEKFGACRFLKK